MSNRITNYINETFVKLARTPVVKSFVKEAKRVGYSVEVGRMGDDGKGQIYYYKVTDGENLVFKAMMVQRMVWGMTFSKKYWQEPAV